MSKNWEKLNLVPQWVSFFQFSFAAGVLLMEQAGCVQWIWMQIVFYTANLSFFWTPPNTWQNLLSFSVLSSLPVEVLVSLLTLLVVSASIGFFFKELKITAFDPALATSLGFNSQYVHYAYMVLVASAIVASFQIVGSILVIAMIICPAAAARLLTDKLSTQIFLSLGIAVLSCLSGYYIAALASMLFSYGNSLRCFRE
ncbi:MAG: iron chelate uptake ABC transporter family permease subunit [Bdellovibrionota bacterium]